MALEDGVCPSVFKVTLTRDSHEKHSGHYELRVFSPQSLAENSLTEILTRPKAYQYVSKVSGILPKTHAFVRS